MTLEERIEQLEKEVNLHRKMLFNRWSQKGGTITCYDDDDVTPFILYEQETTSSDDWKPKDD